VLVKQIAKIAVAGVLASLLGSVAWGQAEKKKEWKDRAEYDLFEAARTSVATDPNKALESLNTWKQKYAATDYDEERMLLFVQTYQKLGQAPKMYEAAHELWQKYPKNIQGPFWLTSLTVSMNDPQKYDTGEKAAKALLDLASTLPKPPNLSDADFKKQVDGLAVIAHTTLGWVAMNKKSYPVAEQELKKLLELNPNNSQASYWLGSVLIAQRVPEKQIQAFYHFARAGHFSGEGAMPAAERKKAADYLQKIYTTFHGDESGLNELIAMSQKSPMPPADLAIKSKEQVEFEREEELKRKDPELALWKNIKKLLDAPDGEQTFNSSMVNTKVKLRGYLVSQTPPERPKTLVLALSDRDGRGEATINLDNPFKYAAPRGTTIRFEGVAKSFTKSPFMLTFEAEQENVHGWPEPPSRKSK
jgi:tetratricopeptide (TPR) repeat protein